MELKSERELLNTREKLHMLEKTYEETRQDQSLSAEVRAVSLRSIKKLINQLTEEIARFEAHHTARS
jgi:flagellar biosynthesis chaperone FliJ